MNQSDQQVCDDLITLLNCIKTAAVQLAEAEGITRMQLFVMHSIHHKGNLAMGQVAGALHCDASNVTGIVDRMVAQGLVVRTECERDRRAKTIELTEKGRKVIEQLNCKLPDRLGCDKLNADERAMLHQIIQKLCPVSPLE